MVEDVQFEFGYDSRGDAATVDGDDFYLQHAQLLALISAYDARGSSLTGADKLSIRDDLQSRIVDSPFFSEPVTVTIVDSDQETFKAEVDVPEVEPFEVEA